MTDIQRIYMTNIMCTLCNTEKQKVFLLENNTFCCTDCEEAIDKKYNLNKTKSETFSMPISDKMVCTGCNKPLNIESDYLHLFKVCNECIEKSRPKNKEEEILEFKNSDGSSVIYVVKETGRIVEKAEYDAWVKRNKKSDKYKITKPCHVGAPAIFALELECRILNEAFNSFGCYLVGSSIKKADWRDVDVRMIMSDEDFFILFPDAYGDGNWEFDPRWLYMTISISERLSKQTGLPIDFQFQPQSHANKWHKGPRHALGMKRSPRSLNQDSTTSNKGDTHGSNT